VRGVDKLVSEIFRYESTKGKRLNNMKAASCNSEDRHRWFLPFKMCTRNVGEKMVG
jgi:hypothetical protein